MKWSEPTAWVLALTTVVFGACGGTNPDGQTPDNDAAPGGDTPAPTMDSGPNGTMPSDGPNTSSSTGGGPPPTGTIPPAESPHAPPSGIAPH